MMAGWEGRSRTPRSGASSIPRRSAGSGRRRANGRGRSDAAADPGAGGLRSDADHRRARRRADARPVGACECQRREEPGGRRFFVNDLNGPLYILDKQSKQFTTYLDFNGVAGRSGLFQKLTFERNSRPASSASLRP